MKTMPNLLLEQYTPLLLFQTVCNDSPIGQNSLQDPASLCSLPYILQTRSYFGSNLYQISHFFLKIFIYKSEIMQLIVVFQFKLMDSNIKNNDNLCK